MRAAAAFLTIAPLPLGVRAVSADRLSDHALRTFEIFKTIIEVDTSKTKGNTPRVARYPADELIAAGFPEEDVEVVPLGDKAALVARYPDVKPIAYMKSGGTDGMHFRRAGIPT